MGRWWPEALLTPPSPRATTQVVTHQTPRTGSRTPGRGSPLPRPWQTPHDEGEKCPQAKGIPTPTPGQHKLLQAGRSPAGCLAPPLCRRLYGSPHSGDGQQGFWQSDLLPAAPNQLGQPVAPHFSNAHGRPALGTWGHAALSSLDLKDPGWPGRDMASHPRELLEQLASQQQTRVAVCRTEPAARSASTLCTQAFQLQRWLGASSGTSW